MKKTYELKIAGRTWLVETGELAQFANGSCLVRAGDTVVLCTATASKTPRPNIDFFPLSVDYEEKMYSVGKIPGGFIKREGRPTENAVLAGRAIDRPLRPLFPSDLRNDVCVSVLVLSVDLDSRPEIVALNGSSIALAISDIPWRGPVAGVEIGLVDGEIILNPNCEERANSDLDLTLVGTEEKVCMIEAGAYEVPDEVMMEAIAFGHEEIKRVCSQIKKIRAEIGKEPFTYESSAYPEDLLQLLTDDYASRLDEMIFTPDKDERDNAIAALVAEICERFENEDRAEWVSLVAEGIDKVEKKLVRKHLFAGRRLDGRSMDQLRDLHSEVGLLPRVHGSGLFQRGETQVLTSCTLAPLSKAQTLDGISDEEEKRYMHHYNMPSYSVGEARPARSPGRREIGHGALAERALVPVLPAEEDFPYAIRLVSEVLMSNGSTSQASVCASTLALMDAGVPISRPVAGISSGLITNPDDESEYEVFVDIQGVEDFFGDMDFKVAGTAEGITAIQVDMKVDGISLDVIREALEVTRKGRMHILNESINPCIEAPRDDLSPYAPKIIQMQIEVDKIREVIGSGGKVINKIIADTGVEIDIEDDGQVYIASPDTAAAEKAVKIITGIVSDPIPGEEYDGVVTRLMSFGAFVEYLPGKEGLVHVSKLAWEHVDKVEDVVNVGDEVRVKILEIDSQGRINLSIRDTQEKPEDYDESTEQGGRRGGGRRNSGGSDRRRSSSRGDRGERGERGERSRSSSYDRGERQRSGDGPQRPWRDRPSRGESGGSGGRSGSGSRRGGSRFPDRGEEESFSHGRFRD
ncbi:MAG: polyribonucleotide nucleotidyltransferase [Clostridiaceae bacterium]|nr:polyribonucleotide nucleotidyltransferase [Clostridiaceae bacterium]